LVHVGTDAKPAEAAAFKTAYGLQPGGATLVRPDGYIAWRSVTAPPTPPEH
jgi:putative polyketide hydroxylase